MSEARRQKRIQRRLARLPRGAQQELLRVLTSSSEVRADVIRQMFDRPDTHDLAEVLIDLESEPGMRVAVVELLRDGTRA